MRTKLGLLVIWTTIFKSKLFWKWNFSSAIHEFMSPLHYALILKNPKNVWYEKLQKSNTIRRGNIHRLSNHGGHSFSFYENYLPCSGREEYNYAQWLAKKQKTKREKKTVRERKTDRDKKWERKRGRKFRDNVEASKLWFLQSQFNALKRTCNADESQNDNYHKWFI